MIRQYLIVISIFLTLFSCDEKATYSSINPIPEAAWYYNNVVEFLVDITDTTQVYDIYLNVNHAKSYEFRNAYILVHTTFPSGKKLEQRLRLDLAEKSGKWRGNCNRIECLAEFPIQLSAYFNEIGIHTFAIEQNMRKNPLNGISDVGLKLYQTDLSNQ